MNLAVETTERIVEGIGVGPGIAIGPAYLYARAGFEVEDRRIASEDMEEEVARFEQAVARSERDFRKIATVAREKLGESSAGIFEAQALMLRDAAFYDAAIEHIRRDRMGADYAAHAVLRRHRQLLEAGESAYFRERANDMLDLERRVVRHLRREKILAAVDDGSILVAENLSAADIILFSQRAILGTVLDHGGATSHVSLMARALGLPAIVGTHGVTEQVASGDLLVLDGLTGRVAIRPTEDTLKYYRERRRRYRQWRQAQKKVVSLPAQTRDGHGVRLAANLEFMEELEMVEEYGAEGVGLFRTEVLFLMRQRVSLSEEEQFKAYRRIVEAVSPRPVTFRLLDFGGDKMLPLGHREHNPFLGWRGVRVLLDKPEMLNPQLRAIVRASRFGPLRILLPMVTELSEVYAFRDLLASACDELAAEDAAYDPDIPVGIMVEVPSVAIRAARFAREVDFFSIGTNDLTQYALAVDRGNDLVADKYQELDPAVLQLVRGTVEGAHAAGIEVSVCGELAARTAATPILLGLGVDELSASPVYLPEVKRVLRAIRMDEAQALATRAMQAADAAEVASLVEDWLRARDCDAASMLETF